MLGSSLGISCSRSAQKAAACLPQTRQCGERARLEVVCAQRRTNEGTHEGFEPPGDSDVAPG
eukprot:3472845-Prymnesium_polylepis.1